MTYSWNYSKKNDTYRHTSNFSFWNTRVKYCKDVTEQHCPSGDKFNKGDLTRKIFFWQDI